MADNKCVEHNISLYQQTKVGSKAHEINKLLLYASSHEIITFVEINTLRIILN